MPFLWKKLIRRKLEKNHEKLVAESKINGIGRELSINKFDPVWLIM